MPAWQITRTPIELQLRQPAFTDAELLVERWRDILGYEGHYQVSDLGRVQSLKNYHGFMPGRILRVSPEQGGYQKVTLSLHSRLSTRKIHQLVADAFVEGPRLPKSEVNHKDGWKDNNRAENLEYRTKKGNMEHASQTGLLATGDNHGLRKWKGAAASGKYNGAHTHPEKVPHGDNHWTRRIPGAQTGANSNSAKKTAEERATIRAEYLAGGISFRLLGQKHGLSAQGTWHIVKSPY